MAVDPHNANRVVAIGTNSGAHPANGIYLSTDQAASWREVLPVNQSANQDVGRTAVAFDPSSFDATTNRTRVVYWSRLERDVPLFGEEANLGGGMMRSMDGGETWEFIPGSESASAAHLSVHPQTGTLLAAGPRGVVRSVDQGTTWSVQLPEKATGITRSDAAPNTVWVSLPDAIWRSDDDGKSWTRVETAGLPTSGPGEFHNITVAPSDPMRLVLGRRGPQFEFDRFYSENGGQHWAKSTLRQNLNLVPSNAREGTFAFRSDNPLVILGVGGDYPALSLDGGKIYSRAGSGVSNILVGSTFQFSTINPNFLLLGLQDYGVVLTEDGGLNWRYSSPGGHSWGGFNYGGYTPDGKTLIVGDSKTWDSPKSLMLSTDSMATWKRLAFDLTAKPYGSYGDPRNANILFYGPFRSADGGYTWEAMEGASLVLSHDPASGQLIGVKRSPFQGVSDFVVSSADGGATWSKLFQGTGRIDDVAWDASAGRVYFVQNHQLRIWERNRFLPDPTLPEDQIGPLRVRSVAVNPKAPHHVYLAANRDIIASEVSALHSPDAGATWQNLNQALPLAPGRIDGGRESHWVRVHPNTGEAWFASSCYGVWIYRPHPAEQTP
ncbi:MAG: hypothetical protein Fur0032_22370 [Terrimicrobiaceae bacterium]